LNDNNESPILSLLQTLLKSRRKNQYNKNPSKRTNKLFYTKTITNLATKTSFQVASAAKG
jgi:hypothetical protein